MRLIQDKLVKSNHLNNKYDLAPWLIAKSTKSFVIFPFNQNEPVLQRQIASLFSHFLPNLHVIVLVESTFDLQSAPIRKIVKHYGERVQLIQEHPRKSVRSSLITGMTYALDQGAKNILQLSALSDDEIGYLPEMLRYSDQYDLVIGSRFLHHQEFIGRQKQQQYNIDRWINGILLRSLMAGKITDATSSIRCWSRSALQAVVPKLGMRYPRLLNLEMTYLSQKNELRIIEFPIPYKPSITGRMPGVGSITNKD